MILVLAHLALANADGKTGATAEGCTCHGNESRQTTVTMTADATTVDAEAVVNITLLVANDDGLEAGMNAAADAGTLEAGTGARESRGEVTHDGPSALSDGETSFQFAWTAPSEGGTYVITGAGNATNADGEKTGDAWAFADDLEIVVNAADDDSGITDTASDSSDDTADDDTGKADDPAGCGCNATAPSAMLLPALGALLAARRRR